MKRLTAILTLTVMVMILVPASAASWYGNEYCSYCGRQTYVHYCNDLLVQYVDDEYHYVYQNDCAVCTTCGNYIYCNDYDCYERHYFVNGYCTLCNCRDPRANAGFTKKVFVCSDSVKLRNQPSGGSTLDSASYGTMFEYAGTIPYGNDGDPWFDIRFQGGVPAYVAAGTINSEFWIFRRTCVVKYYDSAKTLRITDSTHLVKCPDSYSEYNEPGSKEAFYGQTFTCYGETLDEFFPNRVWYLVKSDGAWFFVPAGDAKIN